MWVCTTRDCVYAHWYLLINRQCRDRLLSCSTFPCFSFVYCCWICKCMISRKFQAVTSIVALLVLVCLLQSVLVVPRHVLAVGPAAFSTGSFVQCSPPRCHFPEKVLVPPAVSCTCHWAVLSPSRESTTGLCFNPTLMHTPIKEGSLVFMSPQGCIRSSFLCQGISVCTAAGWTLRLEFSQMTFLMYTEVLGQEKGPALLTEV